MDEPCPTFDRVFPDNSCSENLQKTKLPNNDDFEKVYNEIKQVIPIDEEVTEYEECPFCYLEDQDFENQHLMNECYEGNTSPVTCGPQNRMCAMLYEYATGVDIATGDFIKNCFILRDCRKFFAYQKMNKNFNLRTTNIQRGKVHSISNRQPMPNEGL